MNSNFIEQELDWLSSVIFDRIDSYFKKDTQAPDPFIKHAPSQPSPDMGAYAGFILERKLEAHDRLCLILSFLPMLRPQLLDCFNIKNTDTGRRFAEFGCRDGLDGGCIRPTLETLLFLLSGTDMEKRLQYARHFLSDDFFSTHCFDYGEKPTIEDFMSVLLAPSVELVDNLLFERPFEPRFSTSFPATKMVTGRKWEDLVLDEATLSQVNEIRLWVQYGDKVRRDWSLEHKIRRGYRAMFYGPPGSGKTLTASLLGQVTGKSVYRIDLSTIVSKYIGETEKNLGKVFSMAEGKDWIIFFDEADSLFGKRTGVKDSHDRYANQEVSYLLQRIEDYPGLIVLSTNQKMNIDDAFARRFQSIIRFTVPDHVLRKKLWKASFSDKTVFEESIDWDDISQRYEMTGGTIMNVVQYSSLMAMSRGENVIRLDDVIAGIKREYLKEGKMA